MRGQGSAAPPVSRQLGHSNANAGQFAGLTQKTKMSLRYALIVSVTAKRMLPDPYDRAVRRYRNQLEALRPVIFCLCYGRTLADLVTARGISKLS